MRMLKYFLKNFKFFLPTKSWKNHPQKLLGKTQIHFFFLTASTAQMAQWFQDVAYRPTVYRTGVSTFTSISTALSIKIFWQFAKRKHKKWVLNLNLQSCNWLFITKQEFVMEGKVGKKSHCENTWAAFGYYFRHNGFKSFMKDYLNYINNNQLVTRFSSIF